MLEVYCDIESLYLVEKMLENLSVRVEIRIIKAQKFQALFSVVTFSHGGTELLLI